MIRAASQVRVLAVDVVGPLLESEKENCYIIMVVEDYFSHWMEAILRKLPQW